MTGPAGCRGALVVTAMGAAAVFAATTLLVRDHDPFGWELGAFRPVNGWPNWLQPLLWPPMQFGSLASVPLVAALAWWWLRRPRLAVVLLGSGAGAYLGSKLVKGITDRGRPGDHLVDVVEREHLADGSLGYVSGHATVAATLATLVVVQLRGPWGHIATALAVITCLGRMYVGAHLPLDLVGGVAAGVAVGAVGTLLVPTGTDAARIPGGRRRP